MGLTVLASIAVMPPANCFAQAKKNKGFLIEYDLGWPNCDHGLMTQRITITPIGGPVTSDKTFNAVAIRGDRSSSPKTAVQKIVLKAGAINTVGEIYYPANSARIDNVQFFVETDDNLRLNQNDLAPHEIYQQNYMPACWVPRVLIVSDNIVSRPAKKFAVDLRGKSAQQPFAVKFVVDGKFPEVKVLSELFAEIETLNQYGSSNQARLQLLGLSSKYVHACRTDSLPEKWQGLSGITNIFISVADLETLSSSFPKRKLAVERWVAAGGHLTVLDCGSQFEKLNRVKALVMPGISQGKLNSIPLQSPNEELQKFDRFVTENFGHDVYNSFGNLLPKCKLLVENNDKRKQTMSWNETTLAKAIESQAPLCAFQSVRGTVICSSDDGTQWTQQDWVRMFNSSLYLGKGITQTTGHNTAQMSRRDSLRGIGKPPAMSFRILISLFIFLAGPVSYFFLKKIGKLHLLFLLVPLISAIFCSGLMLYAVLLDGLGVQGRRITVTDLDQVSGKRATSSLHSIYSGLAPRPYVASEAGFLEVNMKRRSPDQIQDWRSGPQRLFGGEARPRTEHQVYGFESTESKSRLGIRVKKVNGENQVTVTNQFAHQIQTGLITTLDAKYLITNLKPGETIVATRLKENGPSSQGSESPYHIAYRRTRDSLGPKDQGELDDVDFFGNYSNHYQIRVDSESDRQAASITRVRELLNARSKYLESPATYLLFLDGFDESAPLAENIQLESNLNVVFGKW